MNFQTPFRWTAQVRVTTIYSSYTRNKEKRTKRIILELKITNNRDKSDKKCSCCQEQSSSQQG